MKNKYGLNLQCQQSFQNKYDNLSVFSTGTSAPITPPPADITVSFLGMKLSARGAETGLNTTFALLIVAIFGAICSFCCFFKARKHSKKKNQHIESIKMEKKF